MLAQTVVKLLGGQWRGDLELAVPPGTHLRHWSWDVVTGSFGLVAAIPQGTGGDQGGRC